MACLKHITTRLTLISQFRRAICHQVTYENSKVKKFINKKCAESFHISTELFNKFQQLDDVKPEDFCSTVKRDQVNLPALTHPVSLDQRDIFFYSIVQISTTNLNKQSGGVKVSEIFVIV